MKRLASIAAAAGLTMALAISGAAAQSSSSNGTGGAAQQDKPSTAGVSNPGGQTMGGQRTSREPMMGKPMRKMKMKKHHRHHRHHRKSM